MHGVQVSRKRKVHGSAKCTEARNKQSMEYTDHRVDGSAKCTEAQSVRKRKMHRSAEYTEHRVHGSTEYTERKVHRSAGMLARVSASQSNMEASEDRGTTTATADAKGMVGSNTVPSSKHAETRNAPASPKNRRNNRALRSKRM